MRTADFYAFMREREAIRLRRADDARAVAAGEAPQGPPWTEDPILREFKFTNIHREHDRTTMGLIAMHYDKHGKTATAEEVLWNCATYRYFGTLDFAYAVGWQSGKFTAKSCIDAAVSLRQHGGKVFTGAYMITMNGKEGIKHEYVANEILAPLAAGASQIAKVAQGGLWKEVAEEMRSFTGFAGSGFMTKEVLLDTMFCPAFWPNGIHDQYSWTPVGPGARRGLNRVLERDLKAGMSAEDMLRNIRTIYSSQGELWPYDTLSMHDIQFQLCEFDKYERARLGEGRPKAKFKPTT